MELIKTSAQIFILSTKDETTLTSIINFNMMKIQENNGIYKKDCYYLLFELIKEMSTRQIVNLFHQRIKPKILADNINDENDLEFLKKLCIIYKEKVVCKQKNINFC